MNITSSAAFNGQSRSPATNFHSVNSFRHQMSLVYQYIYQKKSTLLTSSRLPFHWFFIVLWAVYLPAVPLSEFMVKQALCPFFLQCLWEEKRAFSVGGGCTSMHQVCADLCTRSANQVFFQCLCPFASFSLRGKWCNFPLRLSASSHQEENDAISPWDYQLLCHNNCCRYSHMSGHSECQNHLLFTGWVSHM